MASLKHDTLLTVKLPRGPQGEAVDTLVQLISQRTMAPLEIELLLDDSQDARIIRRLLSVEEVPAAYDPRPLGPIGAILAAHASQLEQLMQYGVIERGQLTIARALSAMAERGLSAADALQDALDISSSIREMEDRMLTQRKVLLTSMG